MDEKRLSAPVPLADEHDLSAFDSGEPELDEWLRRRARKNEAERASRTFVVCETGEHHVVGYYCLATGAINRESAPGPVRRNMPDPIPVMVLGRLAVDRSFQGRGLGNGLLRDAMRRTLRAGELAGIRALLVHALSDDAKAFYERAGLKSSPTNPYTLLLKVANMTDAVRVNSTLRN